MSFSFSHPYTIDQDYKKKVAYFCMEYAIHQSLKIYAGGLGFLASSHMRSAYELKQDMIGIGILWKYGYYDQSRKHDQTMNVMFEEKNYGFLVPTDLKFFIKISGQQVWVTAYYLPPGIFNTAPLFLLTTDLPENDYVTRTISHKLYDANPETRIAAAILLGEGGAMLLEALNRQPEIYHLNESHALPLAFHLYNTLQNVEEVKSRLVFTNHTPEESGNEKNSLSLLEKMNFLCGIPINIIKAITQTEGDILDHTLTALRLSKKANAVSKMHHKTLLKMWNGRTGICDIISITNAQNYTYWHNEGMYQALEKNNDKELTDKKREAKKILFEVVADQCGEIYDENILTLVFAKRFAGYKRPDLFFHDMERFTRLVTNNQMPVQIIWAGKPYPMDYAAIGTFDKIVDICKTYTNCSILVGYECRLSKLLKQGADVWLNVPRLTHEASGTSGITAAMNGAVNVSLPDGWFPEFARDKINSFVIPPCDISLPDHQQDDADASSLYHLLETEILPMYYQHPEKWTEIIKNGMRDIIPRFDSNRMAKEYYEELYI
jgi:starch phosphorylase